MSSGPLLDRITHESTRNRSRADFFQKPGGAVVGKIKIKISFHPLNGLADLLELNQSIFTNTAVSAYCRKAIPAALGI
jgi:hypothetical protein